MTSRPNLSFFFSNGMDPEYAVIGRVARRIWARAMRDRYRAGPRSQMLKYHIQTSGRSLHAREIPFNDIRTTLQALYALFDNCNSLHTNAYDEALTTPTEESVRRAVAIQLIINRELGLNKNQNPWQGSFAIDYLTDLVEEAVYKEFEALSERGGVLGAMETMYQRGKIQEESLYYETKKHDGSLPIDRRQHLPLRERCLRGAQGRAADPLDRGGEAGAGRRACAPSRRATPSALAGGARAPAAGRRRRRQRVRRAHGERSRSARWGRSRTRCIRWAASTGATCKVRLPERGEDRVARRLAQPRHGVRIAALLRRGTAAGRSSKLDASRQRQAPSGGSARRVPRTTAGTSGHPTRTAVTNAPRWNFSSPGIA